MLLPSTTCATTRGMYPGSRALPGQQQFFKRMRARHELWKQKYLDRKTRRGALSRETF
jgi:hypothetical protein